MMVMPGACHNGLVETSQARHCGPRSARIRMQALRRLEHITDEGNDALALHRDRPAASRGIEVEELAVDALAVELDGIIAQPPRDVVDHRLPDGHRIDLALGNRLFGTGNVQRHHRHIERSPAPARSMRCRK